MSDFYVPKDKEKNVKIHIPFTPYHLYWADDVRMFFLVEKEVVFGKVLNDDRKYIYRFL